MSRSGYSDDCEFLGLWQGAVDRAIAGKRGQAFLRELAEAMDAMPTKRLIKHELIDSSGECCTIGVICKSRGLNIAKVDYECPEDVGKLVGISRAMAAEIEYLNDEWKRETSEQLWIRMRKWVEEQIGIEP